MSKSKYFLVIVRSVGMHVIQESQEAVDAFLKNPGIEAGSVTFTELRLSDLDEIAHLYYV